MSIFALMVTRNEEQRYLRAALQHLAKQVDAIVVYDDQSTDATPDIASEFTELVKVRPDERLSFMQHEGQFRNDALRFLVSKCGPIHGDWVLVIDADEFFVQANGVEEDERNTSLRSLVNTAMLHNKMAVKFRFRSMWALDEPWRYRTDGLWPTLHEPRLWRWFEGAAFANKAAAPRNAPREVYGAATLEQTAMEMLHMGYAVKKDRSERWIKYSKNVTVNDKGQELMFGHNASFIRSIMQDATCAPWYGERPAL